MEQQSPMRHLFSILVENKPGVLARVADMFSARGYNIDSLAVGETQDPTISRITCTAKGDYKVAEQIVKQLNKLVDVIQVIHYPQDSPKVVAREMLLVKVKAPSRNRAEVMRIAEIFRAKVVDASRQTLTLEVTGDQHKLEAMMELLMPMGIVEMARTGLVALPRGNTSAGKAR